jgi:hypothetical protein
MISSKGAGYDERGARNYIGNQRAQLSVGSRVVLGFPGSFGTGYPTG